MVTPETYEKHDQVVSMADDLDVEINIDAVYDRAEEADSEPLYVMAGVAIEVVTRQASEKASRETPDGPGADFL